MPQRRLEQTKVETRLAQWRVRRGVTQTEMARATGLSYSTYWRLERGRYRNPPLRYLMNCAIALGCSLEDLLDDEYREWFVLDRQHAAEPPDRESFWRRET